MKFLGYRWTDDSVIPTKLQKEIDDILEIDLGELRSSLVDIAHNESQILQIIYTLGIAVIMAENKVSKKRKEKFEYYTFKVNRTLSSTQVKISMDTDQDIIDLETDLRLLNAKLKFFESIQSQLKQKSSNIRTLMYWEGYIEGNR